MERRVKVVRLSETTPELQDKWTNKDYTPVRHGPQGNRKLFSADIAGECEVVYQRFAPGYLGPYHVHHHAENVWIVLEGELEAIVGGVRYFVKGGETIFMPAAVPHATGNRGPGEVLAVEVYAPPPDRWNPRDAYSAELPENITDALAAT